ncbi:MAG: ribosome-associated translation inhibitor RaiA [Legionellaceae bacterium]|nr:ribosome-associated translation inhibitor RaiA [Legionellaceae bacterium]
MDIQFVGKNVEVTPALRNFTKDKLSRLERHYDHITSMHITFRIEKLEQIVEATVYLRKLEICASAQSELMYTAVDEIVHKLDRQIIKHKEKVQNHH